MLTGGLSLRVQASPVFENSANDDPDLPVEPSALRPAKVIAATIWAVTPWRRLRGSRPARPCT